MRAGDPNLRRTFFHRLHIETLSRRKPFAAAQGLDRGAAIRSAVRCGLATLASGDDPRLRQQRDSGGVRGVRRALGLALPDPVDARDAVSGAAASREGGAGVSSVGFCCALAVAAMQSKRARTRPSPAPWRADRDAGRSLCALAIMTCSIRPRGEPMRAQVRDNRVAKLRRPGFRTAGWPRSPRRARRARRW